MLLELTEEEVKAFESIYDDNACYEYLTYGEDGRLIQNAFTTLFTKLGIDLTGEQNV